MSEELGIIIDMLLLTYEALDEERREALTAYLMQLNGEIKQAG